MFFVWLSKDSEGEDRQKPHVVKEQQHGGGSGRSATAAAASGTRLILPPHTPGAKSGCFLGLDGGDLCCKESIRGHLILL